MTLTSSTAPAPGVVTNDATDAARLVLALTSIGEAILCTNTLGQIAFMNPRAESLTGWTSAEAIGCALADVCPCVRAHTKDPLASLVARHLDDSDGSDDSNDSDGHDVKEGAAPDADLVRRDGSAIAIEHTITRMRDATGRSVGAVVLLRDVTDARRTREHRAFLADASTLLSSLVQNDDALRSLAEHAVPQIADWCLIDLVDASRAGVRSLRRVAAAHGELASVVDLELLSRFPPEATPFLAALRVRTCVESDPSDPSDPHDPDDPDDPSEPGEPGDPGESARVALMRDLGIERYVVVPMIVEGRAIGIITLAMGSVSRRSIERPEVALGQELALLTAAALDRARIHREMTEAVHAREDLVAVVSHDLRNPLTAIVMASTLLLRRATTDPATKRVVDRILASADRARRLVADLLDFSQARTRGGIPIERQPIDLAEVVRQVTEETGQANPLRTIRVELPHGMRGVWDGDRLAQVVANLVGNAVQHSPPDALVNVRVHEEGRDAVLECHNGGPPIAAALMPTLFDPFVRGGARTRGATGGEGGVGLGLYIAHQIVVAHGGTVAVTSTESAGTTFTVRLPRDDTSGAADGTSSSTSL